MNYINSHLTFDIDTGRADFKSLRPTWPRGKNFRPRPGPHAMLASFSRRLSSWPSCQSSKSRHLRYVLLW